MFLRTASDANWAPRETRQLPQSPSAFDGTLQELVERVIAPTMLPSDEVFSFHRALVEYVRDPVPLFLVRAVARTERRHDYRTNDGHTLRATDNSPAWWVYGALAAGHRIAPDCMDSVIRSIPCHMFDVPKTSATVPAQTGWHIAHILNAKDRNTDFHRWSRQDLVRRCVRNLHPANYFLLPKSDWQRMGNDSSVVAFVASVFRLRYAEIWDEFAELAGFDRDEWNGLAAEVPVRFPTAPPEPKPLRDVPHVGRPAVTYRATRLLFKRDLIEPLGDSDRIRIETPVGVFELTKADFCREFAGVIASRSYHEGGVYHFPKPPRRAEQFRVDA